MTAIGPFAYREKKAFMRLRRWINAGIAVVVLCLAIPVLILCAIAIVLDDGFPIIFKQRRVGRFERAFTMYKFRTMKKSDCGYGVSPTQPTDARITRTGRWMRRTSLDELPQLINVVRGEMSLVGPRPEMPFIVEQYAKWQHLRHLVEPGITGLWQISERSNVPLERPEATLIDLDYIRTASPVTDGMVLARTFTAVISANGAF
jgi:lipopolysaccharide/colanic/teichoic acid biosynthesis glycosyltransferase